MMEKKKKKRKEVEQVNISNILKNDVERLKKKEVKTPDNRTSIIQKEEKKEKVSFLSSLLNKLSKDKNSQADKNDKEEKNYVIIRKEVEGLAPLYKLPIMDKFKVTFRYFDIKKGRTERKIAEAKKRQDMKNMKTDSSIKKKITELIEPLLDKKLKEITIEVKTLPSDRERVDIVLKNNYFSMFDITELKINPNYKKFGVNIPRVFTFKMK